MFKLASIDTKLTDLERFVIERLRYVGIIAGGFATYLYNPEKKYGDIDVFVPALINNIGSYDWINQCLSKYKPKDWVVYNGGSRPSNYNPALELNTLKIYKDSTSEWIDVQLIRNVDKTPFTLKGVLDSFDFSVAKAAIQSASKLMVDKSFIEDMKNNRLRAPGKLQKHDHSETGYRLHKYIEVKKFNPTFNDLMFYYTHMKDKYAFMKQLSGRHNPRDVNGLTNRELIKFINFVALMKKDDPMWQIHGDLQNF